MAILSLGGAALGVGAFAGYEALMWAIKNLGADDLEKLTAERLKKEAAALRGADTREAQVMEMNLEAAEQAHQAGQGVQAADRDFMATMFGGYGTGAGGSERDQAIALMDEIKQGLSGRVAKASKIDVSPLAIAAGYRLEGSDAV